MKSLKAKVKTSTNDPRLDMAHYKRYLLIRQNLNKGNNINNNKKLETI